MMTNDDKCKVMKNPLLSVRVPQELMDAISANAAATQRSKSELVITVLDAYFHPAPGDKIAQLRRRLEVVEQRLKVIERLK